ncbi:MAG: FAD-dependent oxidoreductase [Colwellia sp.]|nr:FAD-dependent oxidoreductase [Colwellia sp.]
MNKATLLYQPVLSSDAKIAIIGGGVAGSTIALRFAELGLDTTIIEKGPSLVNGPPICHLHAGGNLYREISDEQCLTLLKQSIDTVKVYPLGVNRRPTVIALPKTDKGQPSDLLPRLKKIRAKYVDLVEQDASNKVLGEPKNYFKFYSKCELEALVKLPIPDTATDDRDWLISYAKHVDLSLLKFPILMVQEYGLSAFRFAAIASLAIEQLPSCHFKSNQQVVDIRKEASSLTWQVSMKDRQSQEIESYEFDYVINACGFKSGEIDDMLKFERRRMVEFKAAYVAHWPNCQGLWPEMVFYGERGTPQGMAQLTPYPNGYFQLHGMTQDITLFKQGIVSSCSSSAQPKLAQRFVDKIDNEWPTPLINSRTMGSIDHLAQYIPRFKSAKTAGTPLFGAQQIPGDDADLRAAGVSFAGKNYARSEIVKASSALVAADDILKNLVQSGLVSAEQLGSKITEHHFPVTLQSSEQSVTERAISLAKERNYPEALAKNF